MSSGEIMGQIQYCQSQINVCEKEIAALKVKIEQQETGYDGYVRARARYEERLHDADVRRQRVETHSGDMRIANKYAGNMGDHLSKVETSNSRLQSVSTDMKKEISDNYDELERLKQKLQRLQSDLSYLQVAYNAACRREAEEAAAAAALAASLNTNKGRGR